MLLLKNDFLLAIETSCDECAISILNYQGKVCANIIQSQIKYHIPYGGIMPNIASNHHLDDISNIVNISLKKAKITLKQIKLIAVTYGPGLVGSLLIGIEFAKGLSYALSIPLIGINHIEGHLMVGSLKRSFPSPPFIGLVVSGGHSAIYKINKHYKFRLLGETIDDAAGEAFDKTAKLLGFEYPGGKYIDKYSKYGDENAYIFPMPLSNNNTLCYSFSGLKTAFRSKIHDCFKYKERIKGKLLYDICASVQKAIVNVLIQKTYLACKEYKISKLVVGGGVCANSFLRKSIKVLAKNKNIKCFIPPKKYCTDNAVMIAITAYKYLMTKYKKHDIFNININIYTS